MTSFTYVCSDSGSGFIIFANISIIVNACTFAFKLMEHSSARMIKGVHFLCLKSQFCYLDFITHTEIKKSIWLLCTANERKIPQMMILKIVREYSKFLNICFTHTIKHLLKKDIFVVLNISI